MQIWKAPVAARPGEHAAGDVQVWEAPGVVMKNEFIVAHVQVEGARGATHMLQAPTFFKPIKEQVISSSVGNTTVYFIDPAASSNIMVSDEAFNSKQHYM